jgi:hypothetical protein
MKTIYKYKLEFKDAQLIQMPIDSEVLSCQMQNNELMIWALIESTNKKQMFYLE